MNNEKKEKPTKTILVDALLLLSTKGFMERYKKISEENDVTFEKAYWMTEGEYFDAFEKHRYKSYDNFRKSHSQYFLRMKEKKR